MKRNNALGRIYSVVGGGANKPTVVFASNAAWQLPPDDGSGWEYTMEPQVLDFQRAYFKVCDFSQALEWIYADLARYRKADRRRAAYVSIIIAVETSQNPALFDRFQGRVGMDDTIRLIGFRLRPGDRSALIGQQYSAQGSMDVGAIWLSSWFNTTVATGGGDTRLHGRPYQKGRIVVSFGEFADEDPPGMDRVAVRKALTAADTLLLKHTATIDAEALLSLNGDEISAAAIMLGTLSSQILTPPAERYRATPWGSSWTAPTNWEMPNIY